ncbi:Bacterial RNA polymerase, alpha chain C terminal domain [Variovorax sp. HW608]|nr:Bacterial RNA polymerase, alpha chain C terminal domain [Variovorax sp. HW608]
MVARETPFVFSTFSWRPKRAQRLDGLSRLTPETLIDELPLRPIVRHALKELKIFCIEDLSAISEGELLNEQAIGRSTINRLQDVLARVGLEFSPNPDSRQRALEESKAVLALSPEARTSALRRVKDSATPSSLGLKPSTLTCALDQGYQTVGTLRKLSLAKLCEVFGRREAREIYQALMLTDRPFAASAPALELWRHGLVEGNGLVEHTASHAPFEELPPWLRARRWIR